MRIFLTLIASLALGGCVTGYTLVSPAPVAVAQGSMKVKPSVAWNRAPKGVFDIPRQENWTQNGPLLDGITFIGALESGQAITKQKPKDDRKVPVFRADMTPQDLVSMIESYYRIRAGATIFESTGVKPTTFLGKPGMQFDYTYVLTDEVKRRGRSVLAVVNGKLYLMALDGAALHYFDAALPEFEALAASAVIS
ncbi:MAG TPA: hypothetical protein VG994_00860 [Steroidobacteraceae bacterium]|nr:hypothetical protein [Steroidobacteraceae bacterium]